MSDGAYLAISAVIVAIIGITPTLLTRKKLNNLQDTVGAKNGNGDLQQMIARVLAWQAEQTREQQMALNALHDTTEEESKYTHRRNHKIINMLTIVKGKVDLMWPHFAEQYGIDVTQLPEVPYPEAELDDLDDPNVPQETSRGPGEPQPPSRSQTPPA
jgi:hypothetical protein